MDHFHKLDTRLAAVLVYTLTCAVLVAGVFNGTGFIDTLAFVALLGSLLLASDARLVRGSWRWA